MCISIAHAFVSYLSGTDMLSWEATLQHWFCLPSEKASTLKGKKFASQEEQILYFLE